MPDFVVDRIPYCENPGIRQIDNFEMLCRKLGERGLVVTDLLYVGVEGKGFQDGSEPNSRRLTWGVTYEEARAAYEEEVERGSSEKFDVLLWAMRPGREVPAIATYDFNQLMPESRPLQIGRWWVHKEDGSVDGALNALIYLDAYRR